MKSGGNGLLTTIFQQLRRLGSAMKEKPPVKVEDYVLEHFMLYHGLIGTTPENQPDFRDVRADMMDAANHRSSVEMAIVLKLSPLIWEDRLEQIVSLCQSKGLTDDIVHCLLPQDDLSDKPPEYEPLKHPDWRVRANAAKLLAFLQVSQAVPPMVQALNEQSEDARAAFCHIAYALAKFNTPEVRNALTEHLYDEDDWFRVDAVGALAGWPLAQVNFDLMKAMLSPHTLSDYASVAIARKHGPDQLLDQEDAILQDGALEVIIGLVQASSGTFANDISADFAIQQCLPRVLSLASQISSPRRTSAALQLSRFVKASNSGESADLDKQAQQFIESLEKPESQKIILEYLQNNDPSRDLGQYRHAIKLAGILQIEGAAPYIVPLLQSDSPVLNDALDTIAALGAEASTAAIIIALINKLVDLDERTAKTLSKQPVFEEDPQAAKTYWHALKALGHLSDGQSVQCLLKAAKDFAPDKRQQAVDSLLHIAASQPQLANLHSMIVPVLQSALTDPSANLKVTALRGIAELKVTEMLTDVMRLTASKESGVSRQAFDSLRLLAKNGQASAVTAAVDAAITSQKDAYRKQQLVSFRASL